MDKALTYHQMKSLYPFMSYLSAAEEQLFTAHMSHAHYAPGSILLENGFHSHIFFMLAGLVRISRISEEGREVVLYRLSQGDFCLMTVYNAMTGTDFQSVAQVERKTDIVTLPAKIFREILKENAELQSYMFTSSLRRLKDVIGVLESITFTGIKQRLAKFLIMLASERSTHAIKITHEQIALEINSSREVVSRTLKNFEDEGVVRLSRGRVHILSLDSLKDICYCD